MGSLCFCNCWSFKLLVVVLENFDFSAVHTLKIRTNSGPKFRDGVTGNLGNGMLSKAKYVTNPRGSISEL